MAIAVDATGTAANNASGTSFNYTGITVGSGLSNGALVVWLNFSVAVSAVTVTWDSGGTNQTMTSISSGTQLMMYGLVNPTAGNKTLAVSWTSSAKTTVCAQSYKGVLQTGGVTTWPNSTSASGTSTAPSVAVTSASGNLPLASLRGAGQNISSVNNTQVFLDNTTPQTAGQTAAGAASVTFSGVLAASSTWSYLGVDMVAAGGGATFVPYQNYFAPMIAQ